MVPFLVSEADITRPIIGNNVIDMCVKGDSAAKEKHEVVDLLKGSLEEVSRKNVEGLVNLIQTKKDYGEAFGDVVVGRKDVVIPKGRSVKVKCISDCRKLATDGPVLFEPNSKFDLEGSLVFGEGVMMARRGKGKFIVPVSNPSSNNVVLKANTHVGMVSAVSSIVPCPVFEEKEPSTEGVKCKVQGAEKEGAGEKSTKSNNKNAKCKNQGGERDQGAEVKCTVNIHGMNVKHGVRCEVQGTKGEGAGDQGTGSTPGTYEKRGGVRCEVQGTEGEGAGDKNTNSTGNEKEQEKEVDAEWLFEKVDLDHLTESERKVVREMLKKHVNTFSKDKLDIGKIDDLKMKINLHDHEPVKRSYTTIPKPLYQEVKEYIEDIMAKGWVQKSHSSYSSPLVCARNKNGTMRLCVDYRKLNNKTIPDSQPIPKVQDILNSLGGNSWFTALDMSKAYHQGFVAEECRHLTAFATPWSLLEWCRIPFGLTNAPPEFQRYMNDCLVGLRDVICIPYIDDVLVYSKSFESHVENVDRVLQRLGEHGIKLNPAKCKWFQREVKYLGHVLSKDGYRIDGASTEVIDKLKKPPKTVGDVRSLLGFVGYYRSFIKNFSQRAKILYDLLCKDKTDTCDGKKMKAKNIQRPSSHKED